MNTFEIGRYMRQPGGYSAFVPHPFPPSKKFSLSNKQISTHTKSIHLVGKLDGVARLLPDKDWFLLMFIRKDASCSSQIEGTNATLLDVIEKQNIEPRTDIPLDVDDIIHYIDAVNYGIKRIENFSFSLRFICELHERLMTEARSSQCSYPGEFRKSQNWIGGTRPDNASFVPPPVTEMHRSLSDLEKFVNSNEDYPSLIKASLLHSQFETIHPFADGNGRTGRMLIPMFLGSEKLLNIPILYLSSYFKKHQQLYYERLNGYHNGLVLEWIDFFLEAIIETANSAINTCLGISALQDRDMRKIHSLGKTSADSTMNILINLFKLPIVGIADIARITRFSLKGGYKAIARLVEMQILKPIKSGDNIYGQKWIYADYLDLFTNDQ